jgi:hypothetical protein
MSFFKVKQCLSNISKSIDNAIRGVDKSLASIEAFANEYHTANRAIKNMARVAIGKEPLDSKKEAGKLAKAVSAPDKAYRAVLVKMKNATENITNKLDSLDKQALNDTFKMPTAKKPSMLEKLAKNKERAEQAKSELPAPGQKKAQEVAV